MCDYSLHNVETRPAKVGDQLVTRQFTHGTRGFSAPEDINVAVCVLPGTELSFEKEVERARDWPWTKNTIHHKTAIFRQVNLDKHYAHHDALEFPDGDILLLTYLMEGQQATVLQLPASAGVKAPRRAEEPAIAPKFRQMTNKKGPDLPLIGALPCIHTTKCRSSRRLARHGVFD